MLNNKFLFELMAPVDTPIDTSKSLGLEDTIELLGEEDEPIKEDSEDLLKIDKEPDKEEVKEDEEEKEEEIKLDDEDEVVIEDVPRKEILKAYPDLFKKFPQLERAYYREQKYAELLPTIEDAKTAIEKANTLDQFSQSLFQGNLDSVLSTLKSNDDRAFSKIVDNYLPTLAKVDQNAYYHVISNVVKNTIAAMVKESKSSDNDQLSAAAVILNQFIFGNSNYEAPSNFSKVSNDNPESQQLYNERSQFIQERFSSALDDLSTKTDNIIKSTISQHIDPKDAMTDYVKRTAIKDAMESVQSLIKSDTRFRTTLDKLWEKSAQSNFSRDSLESIRKAYLSKAKTLLPQIIQKHRNEALKGLGKRVSDNLEKEEPTKKGPVTRGQSTSANNRSTKTEIPRGMKTLDFLMQD